MYKSPLTRTPKVWTFSVTASTAWFRVDVTRTRASWRTRESMMWKIVVLLPVPERTQKQGVRGSGSLSTFHRGVLYDYVVP